MQKIRSIFVSPVLILIALFLVPFAQAAKPVAINASTPLIVVTDVLPDDVEALVALSQILAASEGRDLLVVTSDGQVQTKAVAVHNLQHLLRMAKTQVVAGESNDQAAIDFPYMEPYLDDAAKDFIKNLARHDSGATPWKTQNHREVLRNFIRDHDGTTILLLANPQSVIDSLIESERGKIRQIFGMGLWKKLVSGGWTTAYNTNAHVQAVIRLLGWAKETNTPLFMLPSHLFEGLESVAGAIESPRQTFFSTPLHGGIIPKIIVGLTSYRDYLGDIFYKRFGPLASFVQLWDPLSEAWMQDGVSVAVAADPSAATWVPVNVEIVVDQKQALGIPVTLTPGDGPIHIAEKIDLDRVAATLNRAYQHAQVTPEFSPEAAFAQKQEPPIGLISKLSIDDLGMLRLLLGLDPNRLQLVIAESTQTPLIAQVLRKILSGYGRKNVPVVAGHGQTLEDLSKVPAMGLEVKLLKERLLTKGVLTDAELEGLMKLDPSQLSAETELKAFLEKNNQVDLMSTSSVETLFAVLDKYPELCRKIRNLHIMGGWRGGSVNESGAVRGGSMTRNWVLAPEKTRRLFQILEEWHVKTYVYSSHLAGGSLTSTSLPRSIKTFADIQRHQVEKMVNALRINWNQGLLALKGGRGIDVEANYGPPLAWVMGVREALGDRASQYFPATAGRMAFDGERVDFTPDPNSTVFLVDEAKTNLVLDQSISHLSQKAGEQIAKNTPLRRAISFCQELLWKKSR